MISLQNVSKSFGDQVVLDNVSPEFPMGKTTAIIGPSGTGKSVLLKHLVGLLRPDSGEVMVLGTNVARANEKELFAVRRRVGMLFQDGALFGSLSVGENVAFPLKHHRHDMSAAEQADLVGG